MIGKGVRVLLLLLVGLLWIGQLQRIIFSSTVAVYAHEIVLFTLVSLVLVLGRKHLGKWVHANRNILVAGSLFFISIIVSLIARFFMKEDTLLGWLYLGRLLLYLSCWPMLSLIIQFQWIKKNDVFLGIIAISFGILILGIAQYALFPNTTSLALLGWDDHALRAISTLFDPGFTAGVGVIGLLLLLPLVHKTQQHRLVWLVGVIGLLLTYSRAGFLSFMVGVAIWAYRSKNFKWGTLIILGFISGILLLPRLNSEGTRLERTASISARITTYETSLTVQNPIDLVIGKGWYLARSGREHSENSVRVNPSTPDNPFVHVFESLGLPGIIAFFYVCWCISQRFWKNPAFLSAWMSVLIGSFFNNLLFFPWILILLMGMLTVES